MAEPALCVSALERAGAAIGRPDVAGKRGCRIANAVRLDRLSNATLRPVTTTCETALRLYLWEARHLRPNARALLGAEPVGIEHMGSYSCRTIAGSRRMSLHASARAMDVAAIRLADGRRITLIDDWDGGTGDERAFLRAARNGACALFSSVLSPDYNAAHADHFHFGVGGWRACR